jgi:predicted permease
MNTLWSELRYAGRRLVRRPGFAALALGTLAIGIGGATAIFSVADAVILRPLPYADSDRIAVLWHSDRARNLDFVEMSYPAYRYWRDQNHVFEHLGAMLTVNWPWTLRGRGEPVEVSGRLVTADFFSAMGVSPHLGRTLMETDDRIGADPVVVLSHSLWRERFSEDPAVIGQSIVLRDRAFTVVGVMPREFAYPKDARLWMPMVPGVGAEDVESESVMWCIALGRLKPGVSMEQARTEMSGLLVRYLGGLVERWKVEYKLDRFEFFEPETFAAVITPLSDTIFGPTRAALLAILGTVVLVLLLACANVAGLLLVRTTERSVEMAVRLALGASPGRLACGLFGESLLLAVLGGCVGLLLAWTGIPLLVRLSPGDVPRLHDVALDARVFAFALIASVATAVCCSLAPMLLVRKTSLDATLRGGSRRVALGRSPFRSALVVSQVAIALVLLVGAGLLARSLLELRRAPLGFQPEQLLSVDASAPDARYPDRQRWRVYYKEVLRRVQALPGVDAAATVSLRPLWGTVGWDYPYTLEGQSDAEVRRNPSVNLEGVSGDYFRAMGIAVKKGRVFTDADAEGQPGVVVVSEALARRCWPGQDPLGKRLKIPQSKDSPYNDAWLSVVGLVSDVRYREIQAARLDLYMSDLQIDHRTSHLMVRTRLSTPAVAAAVRETVWSLDKNEAPPAVTTMARVVSDALGVPRFVARLFGAFAFVALLLSALGLYGLLAYSVIWRTREIGVRVALGALPRDVACLVLREGLGLTMAGIVLGLAIAAATTRLLESLLYGVRAIDGLIFAGVAGLLLAVAALASALPLRRALRVDPAVALRHE